MAEQNLPAHANLDGPIDIDGSESNHLAFLRDHCTDNVDIQAIHKVLERYTAAVGDRDSKEFENLLLDLQVPFASAQRFAESLSNGQPLEIRRYPEFRAAMFEADVGYSQTFHNVEIRMDGVLAQVCLDFVTTPNVGAGGRYGWKTLQLLKVYGQWKIASEFYTSRPLP